VNARQALRNGHMDGMSDSKDHMSPAEASRQGLRDLDEGRREHGSTATTPAKHPNGPKFDETASEVHRGGPLADEKK
jgi:hypothetical protein